MKKTKLFLLGTLLSQAASAQTGGTYYHYSYDAAGNIISRNKTLLRESQNEDSENDDTKKHQEDDCQMSIRTNESWSEVQIEIDGDIKQNDRLLIYTSDGFFVASYRLQSNKFTLNLSRLRKGTYLFRFNRNKNVTESKIVKTY